MSRTDAPDIRAWDTAVELRGVTKAFTQRQHAAGEGVLKELFHRTQRRVDALREVDLRIGRGEFVAYAGPNGAGKSTTFKLLCGMLTPDAGRVRLMGLDPLKERIALMRRVGVLFGGRTELWWDYPVLGSFEWKREVWDIPRARWEENVRVYSQMLEIEPFLHTFARELSLGQRMRAELAMLLLHDPEVILLDEPTLGLDVLAKRRMIECLRALNREQGVTILVTSHDMDDLTAMARRLVLLADGRIAFDGTSEELISRAGDRRVLILTREGEAPDIALARHVESEGARHTYAFSGDAASQVLSACGQLEGIRDIEMAHAPIEEMIASLYENWTQKR